MTTTIAPSLGHGPLTQQGVGTSPGYDAVDIRRLLTGVATEGVLSSGAYAVTQRGAGANMSVDIAASTGDGARVQGDAVTAQGIYYVPPHSAVINETITTAHATLPRNDLVVLELKDTQHDASGSNLAQVRVIAGTATAGAAQSDALGVNGTPSLPASAIALAVVNVPATDTAIATSQIDDRRPQFMRFTSGGKCIIATSEARSNTAYGTLTTPDVVKGIVLPTDGLIVVAYKAIWQSSVAGACRAAIFLGSNQLQIGHAAAVSPNTQAASLDAGSSTGTDAALASFGGGLASYRARDTTAAADVTTGQVLGGSGDFASEINTEVGGSVVVEEGIASFGGPCYIYAAAGTYDISVRFKASSGSVTAKNRKLWCWTLGFD